MPPEFYVATKDRKIKDGPFGNKQTAKSMLSKFPGCKIAMFDGMTLKILD